MKLPGAMISLELKGGLAPRERFLGALQIFACAESLGGVESLAEHPAIMTHASIPEASAARARHRRRPVRLSIGLEGEADLCADLEQALGGRIARRRRRRARDCCASSSRRPPLQNVPEFACGGSSR